jgi:hypothetical protein
MNLKILLYILAIIFMIATFFIVPGELGVIHYLLWFVGIAFFIRRIKKELDKGKDTETSKSI